MFGLIKVVVVVVGIYTIYRWIPDKFKNKVKKVYDGKYKIDDKKIYGDISKKIKEYKLDEHYHKFLKRYVSDNKK